MIVSLLISLVSAPSLIKQDTVIEPTWASTLVHAKTIQPPRSPGTPAFAPLKKGPAPYPLDSIREPFVRLTTQEVEADARAQKALISAAQMLDHNHIQEAQVLISNFFNPNSACNVSPIDLESDISLLERHFPQGLREVVQELNDPDSSRQDFLYFKLSLAAAGTGRVFPGQLQYCQNYVRNYVGTNYHPDDIATLSWNRSSEPKNVMLNSCLALGVRGGSAATAYLEMALDLDPANDLAGHELCSTYICRGRYSDALRTATKMIDNLEPGAARDRYIRLNRFAAGKKDVPEVAIAPQP